MRAERERLIVIGFVVLAVAPFVIEATKHSFWERQHSMAPVATAIYLLVVGALVMGRFRWAWFLLVLFYLLADTTWLLHLDHLQPRYLLGTAVGLATLALLLSRPMRFRLRRPVAIAGR